MKSAANIGSPAPLSDLQREFSLSEVSYVLGHGSPHDITKLVHETRRSRLEFNSAYGSAMDAVAAELRALQAMRDAAEPVDDSRHLRQLLEQSVAALSLHEGFQSGPLKQAMETAHQALSPADPANYETILADIALTMRLSSREFEASELRYLKVAEMLGKQLSPAGRKSLYDSIRALPLTEHVFTWDILTVDLREVDKQLSAQIGQLEAIEQKVEQKGEGKDPVLAGTEFSVYVIAALTRGQTVDEILEDYPGLTADQVATAVEYEKAHPKIGRPYPTRSLKRGLAALDLSAIDEFLDDGGEEPGAAGE